MQMYYIVNKSVIFEEQTCVVIIRGLLDDPTVCLFAGRRHINRRFHGVESRTDGQTIYVMSLFNDHRRSELWRTFQVS